jgi:hypothetical protein
MTAEKFEQASSFSRGICPPRFANFPLTKKREAERRQALGCIGTLGRATQARRARSLALASPRRVAFTVSARRGTLASRRSTAAVYWRLSPPGLLPFGRCLSRRCPTRFHQTAFAGPARSGGRAVSLKCLPGDCVHAQPRGTPHPVLLQQCLAKAPSADGTARG